MKVFHAVNEIVEWRKAQVGVFHKKIGFVPTMGCLHEGHLELVRKCKTNNDVTVVSIFVNPSQFAPTEDLDKYPRTLEQDLSVLEAAGVDACFAPSPREMYPQGISLEIDQQRGPFVTVLGVSEQLEGRTRPNFFRGVATVVTKLLNIVSPAVAYFGQKDIQQFIVLKVMTEELFMNTQIEMLPIVRDARGLALSSRNRYLCDESRAVSTAIYRGLNAAAAKVAEAAQTDGQIERETVIQAAMACWQPLVESRDFHIDYVSVAEGNNLTEMDPVTTQAADVVISCAIFVTDRHDPATVVRLIDNVIVPRCM
ncbi:LAMI_0C02982g1_1 [Lachancea mirantina]|uniref:Pantoate--beta-alanine ligase n=1 Tax=Lachancea mirantina TaxID=1230905 RepID=A0A1G4J1G7_9SACH|nr:LAMI_0C02982g1_1 [Lachancea mirantina]